jgi:hypothetical protein
VTIDCKRLFPFLFPKQTDEWLAILRVGLGIELALYCLSARPGWIEVFSSNRGPLSPRRISEALISLESSLVPRLSWFLQIGGRIGISESTMLWMIWSVLLLTAILLVIGLLCRPAAITGWFLHLACIKSSEVFAYGMDLFLNIGLFYLMLAPLPESFALENRIWIPPHRDPRMIGFFRRVLQLHLCVIYFFSGFAKCLGANWWNGLNVWAALTRPPFNVLDPTLIARWRIILTPLGIAICLIETGYPFLIWPRQTRMIWLGSVLIMHAAIGLAMGMHLFALIMILLNVTAFAPMPAIVRRYRAFWRTHKTI